MKTSSAPGRSVRSEDIRVTAQIGVLSAIAFLLMMVEFPLWFAPGFYKLDLSELPVLLGAFSMGPLAGAAIELVKVVLYFFLHGSSTAGVGDLANFFIGCCLAVPAGLIYKHRKTRRGALLGMAVGTLCMTAAGAAVNAWLLLPLYAAAFGVRLDSLIAAGTAVNPAITDLSGFIFLAVVPFNLLKGTLVSAVTFLLYKRLSPILHGKFR